MERGDDIYRIDPTYRSVKTKIRENEHLLEKHFSDLYKNPKKPLIESVILPATLMNNSLNKYYEKKKSKELKVKYHCDELVKPIRMNNNLWYSPNYSHDLLLYNNPLFNGLPSELMGYIIMYMPVHHRRLLLIVSKYFTVFLFKYPKLISLALYSF